MIWPIFSSVRIKSTTNISASRSPAIHDALALSIVGYSKVSTRLTYQIGHKTYCKAGYSTGRLVLSCLYPTRTAAHVSHHALLHRCLLRLCAAPRVEPPCPDPLGLLYPLRRRPGSDRKRLPRAQGNQHVLLLRCVLRTYSPWAINISFRVSIEDVLARCRFAYALTMHFPLSTFIVPAKGKNRLWT